MEGLIGKKMVSKNVLTNPYYEKMLDQSLLITNLKNVAWKTLQSGGNTYEYQRKIRLEQKRYHKLENLFKQEHIKRLKTVAPMDDDANKESDELWVKEKDYLENVIVSGRLSESLKERLNSKGSYI